MPLLIAFVALLLAACGGDDPVTPGSPATVAAIGPTAITGFAGAPVAVSVKVLDDDGRAVAGAVVTFTVSENGGVLSTESGTSGADGRVSVTWTLPSHAQPAQLTAAVAGVTPIVFTATVVPAAAAAIVSANVGTLTGIVAMVADTVLAIRVVDAHGNGIAGRSVTFTPEQGAGSVATSTVTTAADGFATVAWTLGAAPGPQRVTASVAGLPDALMTAFATPAATPRRVGVSRNRSHACALDATGFAACWGLNELGQLGTGDVASYDGPVSVTGGRQYVAIGMTASASAQATTCALAVQGTVWCWGQGPSATAQPVPFQVSGGPPLVQMSVGASHACGLDADDFAWCWGTNTSGQLGVGDLAAHPQPTQVAGTIRFREVTAGGNHTCGLARDGVVHCWGGNALGRLGDGTTTTRPTPGPINSQLRFTTVDAGTSHSCAIAVGGALYCWGSNSNGRVLGDGGQVPAPVTSPVHTQEGTLFARVFTTAAGVCAVTSAGAPRCWGNNSALQLADSVANQLKLPGAMLGNQTFREIRVGDTSGCGETMTREIYCWGFNGNGVTGRPNNVIFTVPQTVVGGHAFTEIGVGNFHACAIKADASTWCWGRGVIPGASSRQDRPVPFRMAAAPPLIAIDAGFNTTCGLANTGAVWCWGGGALGETGIGMASGVEGVVQALVPSIMTTVSVGWHRACALTNAGVAWCWGREEVSNGEEALTLPMAVSSPEPFVTVSVGRNACALTAAGKVYCWGDRSSDSPVVATPVPTGLTFTALAVDIAFGSCFTASGGAGYCFNSGTFVPQSNPLPAGHYLPSGIAACGTTATGDTSCWGAGFPEPAGIVTKWARLSPGFAESLTCGLDAIGSAYCWGFGETGQLGNNTWSYYPMPVRVTLP